jgi:hypothetical protein
MATSARIYRGNKKETQNAHVRVHFGAQCGSCGGAGIAADQGSACSMVIKELSGLPNIGSSAHRPDEDQERSMRKRRSPQRGNSIAEMVLITTPMLLFVMATMELARGMWTLARPRRGSWLTILGIPPGDTVAGQMQIVTE